MNFKIEQPGLFFKKCRKDLKLTLKDVASQCDISVGYLSRIENGSSLPSLTLIKKLSIAYHFDMADILEENELELFNTPSITDKEKEVIDLKKALQQPFDLTFGSHILGVTERKSLEQCLILLSSEHNVTQKNILCSLLNTLEKEGEI